MSLTADERKRRVAILIDAKSPFYNEIDWGEIGELFTEVSLLYQSVKERQIDLILVDSARTDLTRAVAMRIRRHNGLTEIWRLVSDDLTWETEPEHIDGVVSWELGTGGLSGKVDQILETKRFLDECGIVARSARMKGVAESIATVGPTDMSVLIVGPSGVGKELVAEAIHHHSPRSKGPFVAVNCGAIAEGVLESELFGHEKGAFTGSVASRDGLFNRANDGTIFLDEIGETHPDMQVKLLRVLEDGTYYPVGSSQPRRTDVRVVSATNRDLTDAIADREFREDLYFRIAVVKITVPPLMERKGDIQPLLQHFWRSRPDLTYSDRALERLMQFDWPGNVRQLRNFADRMKALKSDGLVEVTDVDAFLREQQSTATHLPVATGRTVEEAGQELIYRAILSLGQEVKALRDLIKSHLPGEGAMTTIIPDEEPDMTATSLEEMERELIQRALLQTNGNRRAAAERLGIGERTLYRKLKKYDLK
ncbi:MAG TPA: sigma-54 dependent transcriptional regulator [candidate division Zixibacteria bacterium]|nr:sigma-54 dependent transcriptional regulator [candidate division Zixibacteria bacterium]